MGGNRAGYRDDIDDHWQLIKWGGAVTSAIRGKRGQNFLKELRDALDALPEKKLIADDLVDGQGGVCAIASVGKMRGYNMEDVRQDNDEISQLFGISQALVRKIESINDDFGYYRVLTPENRYAIVYEWVESEIYKNGPWK